METNAKLSQLSAHAHEGKVKVMILGLGSVGNYLLDYLCSTADSNLEIIVSGRDYQKLESNVNIVKVAATIRRNFRSKVLIADHVDLDRIDSVAACLDKYRPDILVNTSRVYSGLKYGSISWSNVRAYGIWTPLAIKYIRNIMQAHRQIGAHAIVINTSYSDATIPWLKSAGLAYPDFGSGNLNHLLPRIKFALAEQYGIPDFWNINIELASSHFHDVVISKEGQTEGVEQLIAASYDKKPLEINQERLFSRCNIAMPVDAKRNMMNASSNFEIISCLLNAVRNKTCEKFYSPGALGEIGGYPVIIDATGGSPQAFVDESTFSLDEMRKKNRESIALDGVENIENGCLIYSDALLAKIKNAFGVTLPKTIPFDQIDETAGLIIDQIILPEMKKRG